MSRDPPVDPWTLRLKAALRASALPWADITPEPLADTGLAHRHLRLPGTGVLARVPKQSQMGWSPLDNLAYQAACFERMAASGHTPRLHGVLPPSVHLPRGALLVDEIVGRPARLPEDLPAIASALAAIHVLDLPDPSERAPLQDETDALAALLREIDTQAGFLDHHALAAPGRTSIRAMLSDVRARAADWQAPPRRLIAFDAHPGNYIVRPDGSAVLVDLEKARYALPALDLAHATLYTSTTWDMTHRVALDVQTIADTYRHWQAALGPDIAGSPASWLLLRQAMWLWSVTWCAKWQASAAHQPDVQKRGEDWSSALSDSALVNHVRERVSHYLAPSTVEQVMAGFDELAVDLSRPTLAQ